MKRGIFTLIEMMLVISIIILLLSVLLPALSKARGMAKQVGCSNNLRQMGVGLNTYVSDYDGHIAFGDYSSIPVSSRVYWYYLLAPYLENRAWDGSWGAGSMLPAKNPCSVWACPSDPTGAKSGTMPPFVISWGSNGAPKITSFRQPSKKGYLFDGIYNYMNSHFFCVQSSFTGISGKDGYLAMRHRGKCDILFYDGHTKVYGVPPLPYYENGVIAEKWVKAGTPVPDGI